MKFAEVIPELARAIPEFKPDQTNAGDQITYLLLQDLIQFTFGLDPGTDGALLHRIFDFLDRLCESSDQEVRMLSRDVAWTVAEDASLHRFKSFVGKHLRQYIRDSPVGTALLN